MTKVSQIISVPVISLYEGNYEGYVYNVLFDTNSKKCKYFSHKRRNMYIQSVE